MSFSLELFSDGTVREFPRPAKSYKVCGYNCHVYGCIKHIVDYEGLAYLHPSDGLVEEVLYKHLCVDGPSSEWLTKLSGSFFLVILKNDRLFQLITSNDFRMDFYFRNDQTGVRIDADYTQLLPDVIKEDDIDVSSLDYFASSKRNCYLGNTYILGLRRSLPYTIYFLKDGELVVQSHYFHASYRSMLGRYSVEDYLSVVGRALSADHAYSLAYSSGVDSHHLLMESDRLILDDLGVVYYKAPYSSKTSKKTKEVVASVVNAIVHAKPIHIVACDFDDPQLIEYMKDAVIRSPFTHHLAVHFYQLVGELESDHVLTGQNADSVWCFGYSKVTWINFLRSFVHPKSWISTWWPRIVASLSDFKLRDSIKLEKALKVEFRDIPHDNIIDGYALLILAKALTYFPSGDSISWHNAASYHGKTIYYPYCEPLVLHIASCVKRRFSPDPKSQLRSLVPRYEDENISDEMFQYIGESRPWDDATLFRYFEDLILSSPYMKQYQPIIRSIETPTMNARIARIYAGYFLYRFGDRDRRGEEI